jgi:hypothetical protein
MRAVRRVRRVRAMAGPRSRGCGIGVPTESERVAFGVNHKGIRGRQNELLVVLRKSGIDWGLDVALVRSLLSGARMRGQRRHRRTQGDLRQAQTAVGGREQRYQRLDPLRRLHKLPPASRRPERHDTAKLPLVNPQGGNRLTRAVSPHSRPPVPLFRPNSRYCSGTRFDLSPSHWRPQ